MDNYVYTLKFQYYFNHTLCNIQSPVLKTTTEIHKTKTVIIIWSFTIVKLDFAHQEKEIETLCYASRCE